MVAGQTMNQVKRLGLTMHLMYMRCHLLALMSLCLVALSLTVHFIGISNLTVILKQQKNDLVLTQQGMQSESPVLQVNDAVLPQTPENNFYAQLGQVKFVEEQIKTLHELARDSGIAIQQASYKLTQTADPSIVSYTIQLPVKGPYLSIRKFSESFLLAVPFASLDEINLKRDNIQSVQVDTKLRFTLFLHKDNDIDVVRQGVK